VQQEKKQRNNNNNTNYISHASHTNASHVSHMSYHDFDASYVHMRNKFGRVVALYVGPHHKRSKTYVWVPKCVVANMKGPKKSWVPKTKA
jgi:formylmethanofuran dehydrogenase subunit D